MRGKIGEVVVWVCLCLELSHGCCVFDGFSGEDLLWLEEEEVLKSDETEGSLRGGKTPVVILHGMGDSCFNPGMEQITDLAGKYLDTYSVCMPYGPNQPQDTINAYFHNMQEQVQYFAESVRADPNLKEGFDAMGLSQGALVIRGYIEQFNDPPIRQVLSINGPLAGVGSLPRCRPDRSFAAELCRKVTDLVGDAAYLDAIQHHIAQANYLKIPDELDDYEEHNIFLPFMDNDVDHPDKEKFKSNMVSVKRFLLVKALDDTMIFPSESEWFGFYKEGTFDEIMRFNETKQYISDAFGLQTLANNNKLIFLTAKGDHLQFHLKDFYTWLDKMKQLNL